MSLSSALLFLGFEPLVDFVLSDSGSGPAVSQWLSASAQPTQQEIDAAQLPAAKWLRIEAINTECTARIYSRWPADKQNSAALGVYGVVKLADCKAWIEDHVDASNTASNAVLAATTIEDVESVTVTWPVAP